MNSWSPIKWPWSLICSFNPQALAQFSHDTVVWELYQESNVGVMAFSSQWMDLMSVILPYIIWMIHHSATRNISVNACFSRIMSVTFIYMQCVNREWNCPMVLSSELQLSLPIEVLAFPSREKGGSKNQNFEGYSETLPNNIKKNKFRYWMGRQSSETAERHWNGKLPSRILERESQGLPAFKIQYPGWDEISGDVLESSLFLESNHSPIGKNQALTLIIINKVT